MADVGAESSAAPKPLSIKDIFEDARTEHPSEIYPKDAIQQHATRQGQEVYAKHKKLRCTVFPHLKTISAEWAKMSPKDRADALMKVLPTIPQHHRPEAFNNPPLLPENLRGLQPDYYMMPFINVQDLKVKTILLKLIDTRARLAPHLFASTELLFAPYGQVEDSNDRSPLLMMQLDDPSLYGTIVTFESSAEAEDFEAEGKGLSPIAGLQVLYVQNLLYDFLFKMANHLLVKSKKLKGKSVDLNADPVEPAPLPTLAEDESKTSISDMVASEPFGPRRALQLGRLQLLVSAEGQRARDRVWDMREDPRHFEAMYNTNAEHDKAYVPDLNGSSHPAVNTTQFALVVLQDMIARSHYMLISWDQLERQLIEVRRLFDANPGGIEVKTMTPVDLVESIQCLDVLLEKLKTWVVFGVRKFIGSSPLRDQYLRNPPSNDITRSRKASTTSTQGRLCTLLESLCGYDLNGIGTHSFARARYDLDVVETLLRPDQATTAKSYITDSVQEAITQLWILSECRHELKRHPWYTKVLLHTGSSGEICQAVLDINNATSAWQTIFYGAPDGFVTKP